MGEYEIKHIVIIKTQGYSYSYEQHQTYEITEMIKSLIKDNIKFTVEYSQLTLY